MSKLLLRLVLAIGVVMLAVAPAQLRAAEGEPKPTKIVSIKMSDGTTIAAAVYLPALPGKYPALLAASPYRFDNNGLPAIPMFLWRETGPIGWYLKQGYAYVHMDVRGTGRSTGQYRFMDKREQHDLYEVIEWIAKQPWSTGKVGGVGQSYYAMMQWFMAIENPPHLACIAPYDGFVDAYHQSAYQGGIPSGFLADWWNDDVRMINEAPFAGQSRTVPWDFSYEARRHTTYDAFWQERSALERLADIKVPVYSIGLWSKVDLHLNGNIVGFQRAGGAKKLLLFGSANLYAAVEDYSSPAFHEKYLLPFYDWCLKGKETSYGAEPTVRYYMNGEDQFRSSDTWPPANIATRSFYLAKGPSGSVTSLNDGSLDVKPPAAEGGQTVFDYPNDGWRIGVVGFGPEGRPDPVRRVLTFTSAPLEEDLAIAGPIKLVLYASSTQRDTNFIVKVSEQMPQSDEDRQKGVQPRSRVISKGWLRASLRAIDPRYSRDNAPWYRDASAEPLKPGEVYKFEIAVMPAANLFKKGDRIRVELANGDSPITDIVFAHDYEPNQVGRDTIYHNAQYPSQIVMPVLGRQTAMQDRQ
jgi:putative CocE/NonD family hydrolase